MKTTHYTFTKKIKITVYGLLAMLYVGVLQAQDVAVCGYNLDTNDGLALVALDDIPATQNIFVTDASYQPASNSFDGSGSANEGTLQITWTGTWTKGTIIDIEETLPNTFTVTSSTNGPASPNATIVYAGDGFSFSNEGISVFSSCDAADPDNNVVNIYAYVHSEATGALDPNPNDDPDCPCSADFVDVDLGNSTVDHGQFNPVLRSGAVSLADFTNPANWTTSEDNIDLSVVEFSNITFGGSTSISFTAPADLCIDAGVQAGLGGGTPAGGVYSGPGVTDDGNGMTYSFNPASAGVGTHSVTYTYNQASCLTGSASGDVVVFDTQAPSFSAPADLCIDAGAQTGLGGGTPTGGVYSGPGVIDDGNGMTYSFDPATAGAGTHTITYAVSSMVDCVDGMTSDAVEVFALPGVTFAAPADLCVLAGLQTGLGGGMPAGGVYNGPGVTDDGNGMTYSFDPATAGVGTHTISYNVTDANGCSGSAADNVEVTTQPTVMFTAPENLCVDAGVQAGLGGGTPIGGVYSGPGVTDDGNGMTYSFDPSVAGVGTHTITYEFSAGANCSGSASGDVEVFDLPTVSLTLPDTFFVIDGVFPSGIGGGSPEGGVYTDNYGEINDDGNGMTFSFNNTTIVGELNLITYTYTDANGCTNSASMIVFVAEGTVNVVDLAILEGNLFPNPTNGMVYLTGLNAERIKIFDKLGRLMLSIEGTPSQIDLSSFQAGVYTVLVDMGEGKYGSSRLVKF